MVEQHFSVFRVAANRRQGLVQFMADAGRHGAQRREFTGLYQVVLGAYQFLLGVFALQHFLFQAPIQALQVAGPLGHAHFQLAAGLGFEGDALQIMATALHHQAEQQHQHQQCRAADGHHGAHRAVDQRLWGEDFHVPAGFGDGGGLTQPGAAAEVQWLRITGRVGLDGNNGLAFFVGQRACGAEPPLRARGEDHHAIVVGHQQLFRGIAPQALGVVQVDLDHQHTDDFLIIAHGGGEEIAALGRGGAQPEKASQAPGHGFAEIGAKGKIAPYKAVLLIPVGRGEGLAGGVHQVHHLHPGLGGDILEQHVGIDQVGADLRRIQRGAQGRQVTEDLRQHFIAMQGAQQVGDVQVQGLTVLPGQFAAVVALGQVFQRP
ncbi:hypothetical protein [Pseudomonas sp. 24 E 13]|nr:hypothetical protein [Pseudomonas sp. 24 E 13]